MIEMQSKRNYLTILKWIFSESYHLHLSTFLFYLDKNFDWAAAAVVVIACVVASHYFSSGEL